MWTTCCLLRGLLPSTSPHSPLVITMGKKYRSPAKLKRSILRLLDYKQAYLEDCWNTEIEIDEENLELVWKASELLRLKLKPKIKIVETRGFYNPTFPTLPFSEKLSKFQNMWKPDQDSFSFFSCMHHHMKKNNSQCDSFCRGFSSPFCGEFAYFLSTNAWPGQWWPSHEGFLLSHIIRGFSLSILY